MKFKNLSFIDHPATDGVIAQVIDDSGKKISVVAGKGLYSDSKHGHRESVSNPNDAISFEVLVEGEDDVRPYQSREDIDKILSGKFVKPYPKKIVESFISFACTNDLRLSNDKITDILIQLAKDHEDLYYERK